MRKPPIFLVTNHHVDNCGQPPLIDDSTPHRYLGYFESVHGEQAIFVYDRTTREGKLYMGDAGWERAYPVIGGAVPELILNAGERAWHDGMLEGGDLHMTWPRRQDRALCLDRRDP